MCQLYRAMAGGQPGVISHVGLHTYIDPRQEGGRMNSVTLEPLIEVIELDGGEYLFYKAPSRHVTRIYLKEHHKKFL